MKVAEFKLFKSYYSTSCFMKHFTSIVQVVVYYNAILDMIITYHHERLRVQVWCVLAENVPDGRQQVFR